jgi:hypothetical protein
MRCPSDFKRRDAKAQRIMPEFDKSKCLQELENNDWGEPNFDSHLVQECHRLRRVPLKDFTEGNLRIMIGQNIGLKYLMPMAVERLKQNPLAEGDFYAGDLLVNVLRVETNFWSSHPDLRAEVIKIAEEAFEVPTIEKIEFESIQEAYNSFLRAFAPLR